MDINKALEMVNKLHQEKDEFCKKKVKAKKRAIICLVVGLIFLTIFIVIMSITLNDVNFTIGLPLFIIFAIMALIFIEAAIALFVMSKCVYAYQEENRRKILEIIDKEVSKNNSRTNE
ncbi:MAG: hypothetical protein MJ213_03820 [Bacilli bacterium]|nr:hypothetical protein [Bacilli bacterium]